MAGMPDRMRVQDLDVRIEVIPSRTSVRLTVERDASITARVPASTDPDVLARMIQSRSQWLYERLVAREADVALRPDKEFVSGEGFSYLGRSYRLLLVEDGPDVVQLVDGRLRLRRDRVSAAAGDLVTWYRSCGKRWLTKRMTEWARIMGLPNPPLKIRPLGYRWGSCSSDGTVNIHWATMQLPVPLVDYVLVHELAHLRHPTHSPDFWRVVENALPGANLKKEKLRAAGAALWLP